MADRSLSPQPEETTPLLGQQNGGPPITAPNKSPANVNGAAGRDEESPGDDICDDARKAQFQGLPDSQEKLKYIVPAISIGVRTSISLDIF